jgi:hypothetical protein
MVRRWLLGIGVLVAWLAGLVLGTTGAALRTSVGREQIVRWAVHQANSVLGGTVEVGGVGGSFLGGLEIADLRVRHADGTSVLEADRLRVQYRIQDLLAGRIVFGSLALEGVAIAIVQAEPGARWNFEEVIEPDTTSRGGGTSPLVAFADVRIVDGTVVVKTPLTGPPGEVVEWEDGVRGPLQVRRFTDLGADLAYLRVASPVPGSPILAQVNRATVQASDPAFDVRDVRGDIRLYSDSVRLALDLVRLPESRSTLEGTIAWQDGPLLLDLAGRASEMLTDDVRGLVPTLPAGLRGSAQYRVHSDNAAVLEFEGEDIDASGRAGGRLRGRLAMRIGPGDRWAFVTTRLDLDRFDLEYVRGFLDTLPFQGTLTGTVGIDGPAESLRLDLDATLRDHLVAGNPVSYARGRGTVSLAGEDFVFRKFQLDSTNVALTTVRRLVPSVIVDGRLGGKGTLDGSWLNVTFSGAMWHHDRPHPQSAARGTVRIDARTDLVGVWANLEMDSLRLAGFAGLYDSIALTSTWAGTLRLGGYLDSMPLEAAGSGNAGTIRVTGIVFAVDSSWGFRDVIADVEDLDLRTINYQLPRTQLSGRTRVALTYRDTIPDVRVSANLTSSVVEGVPIDTLFGAVRIDGTALTIDTVQMRGLATALSGSGTFGVSPDGRDTVLFAASTDSIGVLEPILARFAGTLAEEEVGERPAGRVSVVGRTVGSRERFQVFADIDVHDLRRGTGWVSDAGASVVWVSDTDILSVDFALDSLAAGVLSASRARGRLHGRPDSLTWSVRSRWGESAWRGSGSWERDSAGTRVAFDSLGVMLREVWFVEPGAAIALDDSGVTIERLTLRNTASGASVAVDGRWPRSGPGALRASLVSVQVPDLLILALRDQTQGEGEVSGTLVLRGRARAPVLDASLELRGGRFGEFTTPLMRGRLAYENRRVHGQMELRRLGTPVLDITVELPVDLALVPVERRRLPGAVSVRARADSVDLTLLEATLPAVRSIGGTFDADVGIEGTWDDPRLAGVVVLRDGAATLPALGVRHEDVNGELRLTGDTVRIDSLSLRSGRGSATVEGFVRLENLSLPLLDLTIRTQNFHVIDIPDFVALTASADLQLRGPLFQATLTGSGTATQGVLHFADLMTKNVVNLEDTLFAEFVDTALVRSEGLGAEFQNRLLDSLRIDSLRVDMGQDFWLRSTEANVLLTGNLFVSKLRDRYRVDGTLQAPRGTYRLPLALGISREFRVTRGQIRYLGTPDLNADLDIDAEHVVRGTAGGKDVEVYVNIGGTMYDPRLTLTSDFQPALSEPEIINYLLFGAPSLRQGTNTAGFESRLLAQWVSTTVSGQLEYALISDLGVPLDYLQIRPTTGTSGVTGAEVAVGKQFRVLGTTAFLTASPRYCRNQATSLASVGASLEFRLSRSWLVAASVDPLVSCESTAARTAGTYQFGADLFWEKSY